MEPRVTDNPDRSRFEIFDDGTELAGYAEYHLFEDEIAFTHTETDSRFKGRGFGTRLVRAALDSARERKLAVLPYCPFVRDWIVKHPDHLGLVPVTQRERFDLPASPPADGTG
jgi:uncharacterized protein